MSFRYPVPDEEQAALMRRNHIDPEHYVVKVDCDEYIALMHLGTRDEITLNRNIPKRKEVPA